MAPAGLNRQTAGRQLIPPIPESITPTVHIGLDFGLVVLARAVTDGVLCGKESKMVKEDLAELYTVPSAGCGCSPCVTISMCP